MKKSKNENFNPSRLRNLSFKELETVLEQEVFDNPDFQRHMKELAVVEEMTVDEVTRVIKQYLLSIGREMVKITKVKRRIVLFGFMTIEIQEIIYDENSIYYKHKHKF